MEDVDMDHVVDVPDTPDRLAACYFTGQCGGKESCIPVAGNLKEPDFRNEEPFNCARDRDRLPSESNGRRRLYVRSQRNISNAEENRRRSVPAENSHAVRNAQLSRRMEMDKNIKHEHSNCVGDKGKRVCSNFDPKSPASHEDDGILNLSECDTKTEMPKLVCPFGSSQNQMVKEISKGKAATDVRSLDHVPHISNTSLKSCKGKEKADSNTGRAAGSIINSGQVIDLSYDSQRQTEKPRPIFLHSVVSPKVTGRKRLVRNGCISPHNIAIRAKQQTAESQSQPNPEDCYPNHTSDVVSNGLPCLTNIREIVAEENDRDRGKGKGLSNEHDNIKFQFPGRSMMDKVEVNGTGNTNGDAYKHLEELGGWRSTRNRMRNTGHPLSDAAGHLSIRNDASNPQYKNSVGIADDCSSENIPAVSSSTLSHGSQILSHLDCRRPQEPKPIPKRQRTNVRTLRNHGECSTSVPNDSEIVCLESPRESLAQKSRFGRTHDRESSFFLNQVIDIDELSPEVRHNSSHARGGIHSDDQDSRAIQLQADEMLARELQEQLYNEVPVFGGDETDEHIALSLQHEDAIHASSGHSFRNMSLPDMHAASQPLLLSSRSSSLRRGIRARILNSARGTRSRNRISRPPAAIQARQENIYFPAHMGIEMRLDFLEAIEAALEDVGPDPVRRGRYALQLQGDFNENDYEMLLALDENNHHVGATTNQINGLPLSTVQTENLEEACAICLEAPSIGDTIRHLPCLHKFHKDCIDPWLSRSTSCPVCKFSIT